jgi:cytochrome P450
MQRCILHNEEQFEEPTVFKPELFLTADGQIDPTILSSFNVAFGFGRRYASLGPSLPQP